MPANTLDILRPSVSEPAADVRGYIQSVEAEPVGAWRIGQAGSRKR